MEKFKVGDWVRTSELSRPAQVVAVQGRIVKVRYDTRKSVRHYYFEESEVKKA